MHAIRARTSSHQLLTRVANAQRTMSVQAEVDQDLVKPRWWKNQQGVTFHLAKTNENFLSYYKAQKTCDSDEEWLECVAAMRRELPQSFRLRTSNSLTFQQLDHVLKKHQSLTGDNSILRSISWPAGEGSVWQFKDTSRWVINESERLQTLKDFIVQENYNGFLSRQELVSMVPVFLLDLEPHHRVLDMCSSPGSKTKQVVEIMHSKLSSPSEVPKGLLVANEFDVNRCDRLIENVMRYSSPCCILVNHDGQSFPDIDCRGQPVMYDRIVCDVPCSGDGTIRKNPNIWASGWNPGKGNSRHFIQYNILERGVELLDVGGIIAYSSCAMNPIENEAVVARLFSQAEGCLELLDCDGKLPGLKFAKGFTDWKVFDADMNVHESFEQVPEKLKKSQIHEGMFPNVEFNQKIGLDLCLRLLPHHNDDGGFFVAMIKKVKPLPWENAQDKDKVLSECPLISKRVKTSLTEEDGLAPLKSKPRVRREVKGRSNKKIGNMFAAKDFFTFCEKDDVVLSKASEFYGFKQDPELFFHPHGTYKNVYSVNEAVKDVLTSEANQSINIFIAGIKALVKESRSSSAVQLKPKATFAAHVTKRTLEISANDMIKLLEAKESVEFKACLEDSTTQNLNDMISQSGVGVVKFSCRLPDDKTIRYEALGFVGRERVLLDVNESERYHGLLTLDQKSLTC